MTSNAVSYGKIMANALDVTDGTEDGQLDFKVVTNYCCNILQNYF